MPGRGAAGVNDLMTMTADELDLGASDVAAGADAMALAAGALAFGYPGQRRALGDTEATLLRRFVDPR